MRIFVGALMGAFLLLASGADAATRITPDMSVISKPGEYFLTEDQFRPNSGLTIQADNVFINLNGHYFGGYGPMAGISASGHSGITIANGTVWGHPSYRGYYYLIRLSGGRNNVITNVIGTGAQAIAFWMDGGIGGLIQNCSVHDIGKSTVFDRSFAYTLYGTGHTLQNSYAWYIYGRIESGAVSVAGDGNRVLNNPTFNCTYAGGTCYAAWFSSGNGIELKGNRFVGGYMGAVLSSPATGSAGSNRFENVVLPYAGAWIRLGGDAITP